MKIALEEHFLADKPEHIDRWRTLTPMIPESVRLKLIPSLCDLGDRRLEAMDRAGIGIAVLSYLGTVQGTMEEAPALRVAQESNDCIAEAVNRKPDRYAGFASVPLQNPQVGANELERAVRQLGLKGAMLFGHTNGLYLDHPRFAPFWERAEALGAPVYLHASDAHTMPVSYSGRPELMGPVWSWTAETATHALRLLFGGVLERFPGVTLILGHLGETLPFLLWRLDTRAQAFGRSGSELPSSLVRRNVMVTTSGMFSDAPLLCALEALGDDRIMFSVDHPFESMDEASKWFDSVPVSALARHRIGELNARRVLRLGL